MGKFKARYVVIPLIVVAAAGAVFGLTAAKKSNDVIKVAPVSEASVEFGGYSELGDEPFYGKLRKGSIVNIKPDKELKIDSVNVKKGDIVKKGDVLISYDTHSLSDAVSEAELLVKTLTNEITIADNELDVLRRLQPSENAPQEDEDEEEEQATDSDSTPDAPTAQKFESKITEKSMPLAGTGKADDPLIYMAGDYTTLTKEFLAWIGNDEAPLTAIFYICDDETGAQLYAKLIDGSKINSASISDYKLSDGVTVTPDGMITFGSTAEFATFVTIAAAPSQSDMSAAYAMPEGYPEIGELPENIDTDASSYEISLDDNYKYSAQEIKDMIAEKEKQKASLDFQKRQAELNVKKAKKLAQTGGEISVIDGKVTFVAKDIYHLSESGAYITVANDSGMSITSTIGEFSMDRIEEGLGVKITNFETGGEGHGVITEIDESPISQASMESMFDSMESQYNFTVTLDENMDISEESEVQLVVEHEDSEDPLYLPKALVRMEAGRAYVLIEGDDGRLKKQYIVIGQQLYEVVRVAGGLSGDDMIAFPYGKAKVGSETEETDFESMYYNFGLFF